jgi:hypothetical protein
MGASNGTVIGITKILDNGPSANRLNIVLVAEGFTNSEQDSFDDKCQEYVDFIQAESWFTDLGAAINIYRLNVSSDQSGADDPNTCGDGSAGSGTFVDTFFDASFCNSGIRRCLLGDGTLVRDTLDGQLPEWHAAGVIVNTTQYGGCASGDVFWTSVHAEFASVTMHEFGHSIFGLADEYQYWEGCSSGETDRDEYTGSEPSSPNLTSQTNRADIKWNYFINDSTPVPTMVNPDCSNCDERANVLSDDTIIGEYEGAGYFHCGKFRPAYTCRMRSHSVDFCRVCVDAIADSLSPFLTSEATIEIIPGDVEFGDVGFGFTMYRSFEIRNVKTGVPMGVHINLSAITGDTAFAYVPGTVLSFKLPAPVFESYTSKIIFVAFTSVDDGTPNAAGSLTVSATEATDTLPLAVSLTARAIAPPAVDSVLVIDRSGSMSEATGIPGETKTDHALSAASLYVSLLKNTDRIGIVRFNNQAIDPADILLGIRLANATGKNLANSALANSNFTPTGSTSIGGGIILGSGVLDDASADNRAILVLTDGIQNTNPDIPDAIDVVLTKTPEQRVFAIGLGLNQLEDELNQIASFTNGVAQITGDIVLEKEFILQKLYVQILSDISDEAFVKDPKYVLPPGQKKSTSIFLGEVDISADFIVVFRENIVFPKYMNVWLEAPDGTIIDQGNIGSFPNAKYNSGPQYIYFRIQFPVFPTNLVGHIGRWKVWVENFNKGQATTGKNRGETLVYSVMCKARSNFRLGGRVEQNTYHPSSPMNIVLEPSLYGLPVAVNEPVQVEVQKPDGGQLVLPLKRNETGQYEGLFTATTLLGAYLFTANVSAKSPQGHHITRFRQMTGIIYRAGKGGNSSGNTTGGGKGDDCCNKLSKKLDKLIKLMEPKRK